MNNAIFYVVLQDDPEQSFFSNGSTVTEIKATIIDSVIESNTIEINLIGWEEIANLLGENTQIGDHLIVEGNLTINLDPEGKNPAYNSLPNLSDDFFDRIESQDSAIECIVSEFERIYRENTDPGWEWISVLED